MTIRTQMAVPGCPSPARQLSEDIVTPNVELSAPNWISPTARSWPWSRSPSGAPTCSSRRRNVAPLGSLVNDRHEHWLMTDAAKLAFRPKASPRCPAHGYSRQDRSEGREPISAPGGISDAPLHNARRSDWRHRFHRPDPVLRRPCRPPTGGVPVADHYLRQYAWDLHGRSTPGAPRWRSRPPRHLRMLGVASGRKRRPRTLSTSPGPGCMARPSKINPSTSRSTPWHHLLPHPHREGQWSSGLWATYAVDPPPTASRTDRLMWSPTPSSCRRSRSTRSRSVPRRHGLLDAIDAASRGRNGLHPRRNQTRTPTSRSSAR